MVAAEAPAAVANKGQKRVWVKAFETPLNHMLNSYGLAKYVAMDDKAIWNAMTQPLKSGTLYMTEYASETAERRGIACNRWLKSLLDYLEYQNADDIKKRNKYILNDPIFTSL